MKPPVILPTLAEVFSSGYDDEIIRSLIDSIRAISSSRATDNAGFSDRDDADIFHLTRILEAVLQDRYGIGF